MRTRRSTLEPSRRSSGPRWTSTLLAPPRNERAPTSRHTRSGPRRNRPRHLGWAPSARGAVSSAGRVAPEALGGDAQGPVELAGGVLPGDRLGQLDDRVVVEVLAELREELVGDVP